MTAEYRQRARESEVRLRPDVQGLRALAVGLVVLYHLWPDRLPGGFIGVDIFFVISGFLIVGHLLKEAAESGRVRLGRFWMRRARRILPLALLVLGVTGIATAVIAPLGVQRQYFDEIIAAVFFAENWRLASDSLDYLRADYDPSPVQQFWSLGVEEQFYVALPLIIVTLLTVATATQWGRLRLIGIALVTLGVASFALSILMTPESPGVAYFGTHTRLWQFLAGGLLALLALARPRALTMPTRAAHALAGIGAALMVFSAIALTGDVQYPGAIAVVPVLGVLAVIAAGPESWFGRLSALQIGPTQPVLWLGAISYGTYLWHWPLIVFVTIVAGPVGIAAKVLMIAATLSLASASKRWVEDPVRFRRWQGTRRSEPIAVAAIALGAMLVVAGGAGVGVLDADRRTAALAEAERPPFENPCFGAGSLANPVACADVEFDRFYPNADILRSDDGNRGECWSSDDPATLQVCSVGPADGSVRAIALGDSFNGSLVGAYELIAERNGWSLDIASRRSCPWGLPREESLWNENCQSWNDQVDALLASGEYDLILTTSSDRAATPARVDSFSTLWREQIERGMTIVAIGPPPRGVEGYLECVERVGSEAPLRCDVDRAEAFRFESYYVAVADAVTGATVAEFSDLICPGDRCSPVIGGAFVYRDGGHLSATFSATLAPHLADRLAAAYEQARRELSP